MNLNGTEYYYVRNSKGDIIGLIDGSGTQVVSYVYDTWGKLISISGSLANSVGVKNPYRYRGYRYDTETGLYYLQSRYYNPEWGRFINGDGIIGQTGELLGHNLFTYCKNNPVNMSDSSGYRPLFDDEELQRDYGEYLKQKREEKKRNEQVAKVARVTSNVTNYTSSILSAVFGQVINNAYKSGDAATIKQTFRFSMGTLAVNEAAATASYLADTTIPKNKKFPIVAMHETNTFVTVFI